PTWRVPASTSAPIDDLTRPRGRVYLRTHSRAEKLCSRCDPDAQVRTDTHAQGVSGMRSSTHTHRLAAALVAALVLAASSVAVTSPAGARVTAQARGFDGTTITVGGLGNMATVGAAQVGAKARIERFNKTHEIKGVKIDYVGFEDDKGDPATALTQARKLVTQDRAFAIVGDSS